MLVAKILTLSAALIGSVGEKILPRAWSEKIPPRAQEEAVPVLYSASGFRCPPCEKVEAFIKPRWKYKKVLVDNMPVPQVHWCGRVVEGYHPDKIERLLSGQEP